VARAGKLAVQREVLWGTDVLIPLLEALLKQRTVREWIDIEMSQASVVQAGGIF